MRIVIQTKFNNPDLSGDCFCSFECNVEVADVETMTRQVLASLTALNAPNVEEALTLAMKEKLTFDNHFINNEYRILFVGRFANNNLSVVVKELRG